MKVRTEPDAVVYEVEQRPFAAWGQVATVLPLAALATDPRGP